MRTFLLTETIKVRVTKHQRRAYEKAAAKAERQMSDWVRSTLNERIAEINQKVASATKERQQNDQ